MVTMHQILKEKILDAMDDDGRSSSAFFDGKTSGFGCGENGSGGESGELIEGKSEYHLF